MQEDRSKLFPQEYNWGVLPEQKMYKVSMDDADYFDLNTIHSHPLIFTNDIFTYMMDGDPGDGLDWHTHMPDLDQINVCLEGEATYTLEQPGGSYQEVEIGPGELVYLPGGARHKMEVTGDSYHRELSIYKAKHVGRLEMVEAGFGVYSLDDAPIALQVDRERDEVVRMNEDAVDQ